MKNYFRITTYSPEENVSAIVDCYGKFDQVWQFSAYLVKKKFKIHESQLKGTSSIQHRTRSQEITLNFHQTL